MNKDTDKVNILNMTKTELSAFLSGFGEPEYRASQIFSWLHKGAGFYEMSDISKKIRGELHERAYIDVPGNVKTLTSKLDGTKKYLFRLRDGELIESVFMKYKHGASLCVSSQAGCRMGCKFCASALNGLSRNLEPSEMLGQIIAAEKETGERISNIVMMGIGEPLDNYANTVKFLRLVNEECGLNIGYRHISLSTCGIVDKIYKLAEENIPITLSVSLHAVNDAERSELMPVNNKWGLNELMAACADYFKKTGRRISFEYALIAGINDSAEHAYKLNNLLRASMKDSSGGNMPLHVNLIPANKIAERRFERASKTAVNAFAGRLSRLGVNATVRRALGADINASCGQLRKNNL